MLSPRIRGQSLQSIMLGIWAKVPWGHLAETTGTFSAHLSHPTVVASHVGNYLNVFDTGPRTTRRKAMSKEGKHHEDDDDKSHGNSHSQGSNSGHSDEGSNSGHSDSSSNDPSSHHTGASQQTHP